MTNLMNGLEVNEYIKSLSEEHQIQIVSFLRKVNLSEATKAFLRNISEEIKLVMFSEGYCPDCRVIIPFIKIIEELNNNIKVSILSREDNPQLLKECSGDTRIPTILTYNRDMKPLEQFIEFPLSFKNIIKGLDEINSKELIKQYREGKYNDMIEEAIVTLFSRKE